MFLILIFRGLKHFIGKMISYNSKDEVVFTGYKYDKIIIFQNTKLFITLKVTLIYIPNIVMWVCVNITEDLTIKRN